MMPEKLVDVLFAVIDTIVNDRPTPTWWSVGLRRLDAHNPKTHDLIQRIEGLKFKSEAGCDPGEYV